MLKSLFRTLSKIWLCLAAAVGIIGLSSCSSSGGKDDPTPVYLNVKAVGSTSFGEEGGEVTVDVYAPEQPKVAVSSGWVKASGPQALQSKYVFVLKIDVNASPDPREAQVSFTASGKSETIVITQKGATPKPVVPSEPSGEVTPTMELAYGIGLGWNLGNQLDAYVNNIANETSWGNKATTQELFDKVAAAGFTSVRIPVTWLGKVGTAPDYKIDADWLARVKEVVGYAENAGLKVIINIHHDGADSKHWLDIKSAATNDATNTAVKAQLKAMWTQIAEAFADKGESLIFEAFNEVHDGGWGWGANLTDGGKQYAVVNEWVQVFVDAVRATGGNNATRYLGIPGYCTDPELTINNLVLPKDSATGRLFVAVHFYAPNEFTLNDKYSEWGHTASGGKKESWGDEDNVTRVFGLLKAKYIDNGIPVYIGEMGCVHRASSRSEAFRKYYLNYVCKAARAYGMAALIWDNGSAGTGKECSGMFDHANGKFLNNAQEVIEGMVNAYTNPDLKLSDVYNTAP